MTIEEVDGAAALIKLFTPLGISLLIAMGLATLLEAAQRARFQHQLRRAGSFPPRRQSMYPSRHSRKPPSPVRRPRVRPLPTTWRV